MAEEPPTSVSAPARLMLFGDLAVYFGEPAVAVAVELRARCSASPSSKFAVDGEDLDPKRHPRIRGALLQAWTDMDRPLRFVTGSDIHEGWGLGESAARTVACLGAISMIYNHIILEEVASNAVMIERELVEGWAPLDVSVSAYGEAMALMKGTGERGLWKVDDSAGRTIQHIPAQDWTLVIGKVHQDIAPGEMYLKLKRFHRRNAFARDIVRDMGRLAVEGQAALRRRDMVGVGELMGETQRALVTLGLSHGGMEKVVKAVARHSYGVKLNCDEHGFCICALTDRPELAVETFTEFGGQAEVLTVSREGLRLDDEGRFFVH